MRGRLSKPAFLRMRLQWHCPGLPLNHCRLDNSLARGVRFLLKQQSPDGAWRSETYGAFKDGLSLTPLVLHSLLACSDRQPSSVLEKGALFLASAVRQD